MVDQYYYGNILGKLKKTKRSYDMSTRKVRSLEKKARKYEKKDEKKAAKYREKAEKAAIKAENIKDKLTSLEKQTEKVLNVQLSWLEADLASSKKPWIFLVYHEPGWSAKGSTGHPNNAEVQRYLQPLMEKHNVSIAFAGHNHFYARALVNGIQHITTGGAGAPLHYTDADSPKVVTASKTNHFCKVEIDGNLLKYTAVKPDGTAIDTFTIKK